MTKVSLGRRAQLYVKVWNKDTDDLTDPAEQFIVKVLQDRERLDLVIDWHLKVLDAGLIEAVPSYVSTWSTMLPVTQYDSNYNIDKDATVKLFARIIQFARQNDLKVTKEYDSSTFSVHVWLNNKVSVNYYASREMMCTKVYKGTKVVPAQPEQVIDEYDWECEKIAFTEVEVDD